MTRIVALGCGGFIGSHLLERLLARPDVFIVGWDPEFRKIRPLLASARFRLHRSSIHEPAAWSDLERDVDAADIVINLAAICNPAEYNTRPIDVINANLFDIYKVVELCSRKGKWLISFSTSEVYGRTLASYVPNGYSTRELYELDEDATPLIMGPVRNQRWTYACAKQLLERLIYAHHKERGLPFTIIRPLNFFGPRMDYLPGRDGEGVPRVLACFMSALIDGKPMQVVDGGAARRTIISIHDAIDAISLMIDNPAKAQGEIFNVGNRHNEVTMLELARVMRDIYATITENPRYREHPIESVSSQTFYGEGYEDCDRRMPKIDKATARLGWAPRRSLQEALLETMTYYHRHYAQPRQQGADDAHRTTDVFAASL